MTARPRLLEVEDVAKRFGAVVAVDSCSLWVEEGSITGLIGPNGSGKTTLFNLVTGFVRPDRGRIAFASEPITGLAPNQVYQRGIARTFQLARVFPRLSVLENMLVPVRRTGLAGLLRHATASEEAAQAHDLLGMLGLAALAGEQAGRLSYGQRKLLELGAIMMSSPRLVMLDEPAGGVNPALLETIGARIRELNGQGVTFLLVEHNLGFVMDLCHAVVVLDQGRPIARGTPAEVRADQAVLDAYLGA